MANLSDLINIKFQDSTSYSQSFTDDVLVVPFFHSWGPVEEFLSLDKQSFFERFQESLPAVPQEYYDLVRGGSTVKSQLLKCYRDYVNIKRAFSTGMGRVLSCRVSDADIITFVNTGSTPAAVHYSNPEIGSTITVGEVTGTVFAYLKYKGIPTYQDLGIFDNTKPESLYIKSSAVVGGYVTIEFGYKDSEGNLNVVESFYGSTNNQIVSGDSEYIDDVIKSNSNFIKEFTWFSGLENTTTEYKFIQTIADSNVSHTEEDYSNIDTLLNAPIFNEGGEVVSNYYPVRCKSLLQAELADIERTDYTLILPPAQKLPVSSVTAQEIVTETLNAVASRKDCNALIGFDVDLTFDYSTINDAFNAFASNARSIDPTFFSFFLAAREKYSALGTTFKLDGTAGWAGRIASVAQSNHLNQLPSARAYGAYNGELTNSLTFTEVLALHELGCNSIYNTATGPQIFGIKTPFQRQASYWAKANVARVTARLIKYVYPAVLNVVHTETVSDPIERARYTTNLVNILDEFKSNRDIKNESYVITDDSINSDSQTKGGEILNTIFVIYFKKLTEKVNIKFIATDSSVSVEIS